jgi:hypothetical protein
MYGLTRGTMTLIGAAAAGALLWLASQMDADSLGGYWAFIGLTAAAGLAMALSQLLGGWTKWGWPRISASVFLLGFLPGLVAGGLVVLALQPESAYGTGWASDVGLGWLVDDLTAVLPAVAFGLGLLFGLTFDTTGPRVREVDVVEAEDEVVRRPGHVPPADEPVAAERRAPVVDRDADGVDDREQQVVGAGAFPDDGAPRRRRFFDRH